MKISSGPISIGYGDCAKQRVVAILIPKEYNKSIFGNHYSHFIGINFCKNPQKVCPRLEGEDYTKCISVCQQTGHAEINVLRAAGEKAKGSIVILSGHDHCCDSCIAAMNEAGVEEVIIL